VHVFGGQIFSGCVVALEYVLSNWLFTLMGKIGGGKAFKESGSHLIRDLKVRVGGGNNQLRSLMR